MLNFLLLIALIVALVDWVAVATNRRSLEYLAKPAVMVILLVWICWNGGLELPTLWFTLGLLCSLAGDVFLMLPKERFLPGLISFLVAHIFYLIGFSQPSANFNVASLIILSIILTTGLMVYRRIAAGLVSGGQDKLKMPVLMYSLVISLMLFSALNTLTRPDWRLLAALSVSIGALLFFLSDTLLAWNKFVSPLRNGRLLVMITYHLGQIGIALGAVLQVMK